MNIVSSEKNWINNFIPDMVKDIKSRGHKLFWTHTMKNVEPADITFYLGYGEIVKKEILMKSKNNIVVHSSNLPKGRGWSPLNWQILEGKNKIPISLFEAEEKVDRGVIYIKEELQLNGDELIDEIRNRHAEKIISMCIKFLDNYPEIIKNATDQKGDPTYYRKRNENDSEIDPGKTIKEQFNLLRVVDNENYPAFFKLYGNKYIIKIYKSKE